MAKKKEVAPQVAEPSDPVEAAIKTPIASVFSVMPKNTKVVQATVEEAKEYDKSGMLVGWSPKDGLALIKT